MIIGLHGKLGSGKDTVYERLRDTVLVPELFTTERRAFADKLKDSACALLGITREEMEALKRESDDEYPAGHGIGVMEYMGGPEYQPYGPSVMTMRTFLQRYGTEAHRAIFGDDFWVKQAMVDIYDPLKIYVFTDVRFENEAHAIKQHGGVVWQVVGPDDDTGDHASEQPLAEELVDHVLDNTKRQRVIDIDTGEKSPDFSWLDDQIHQALEAALTTP